MIANKAIKQEVVETPDVSYLRPVIPAPEKTFKISLKRYRKLIKEGKDINKKDSDPAEHIRLKKLVLDMLKDRPSMWKIGTKFKKENWEKLAMEVYERRGDVVSVPTIRNMLKSAKDVLRRKLKRCIQVQKLNRHDTLTCLWKWEFFGYCQYYHGSLAKFETELRGETWNGGSEGQSGDEDDVEFVGHYLGKEDYMEGIRNEQGSPHDDSLEIVNEVNAPYPGHNIILKRESEPVPWFYENPVPVSEEMALQREPSVGCNASAYEFPAAPTVVEPHVALDIKPLITASSTRFSYAGSSTPAYEYPMNEKVSGTVAELMSLDIKPLITASSTRFSYAGSSTPRNECPMNEEVSRTVVEPVSIDIKPRRTALSTISSLFSYSGSSTPGYGYSGNREAPDFAVPVDVKPRRSAPTLNLLSLSNSGSWTPVCDYPINGRVSPVFAQPLDLKPRRSAPTITSQRFSTPGSWTPVYDYPDTEEVASAFVEPVSEDLELGESTSEFWTPARGNKISRIKNNDIDAEAFKSSFKKILAKQKDETVRTKQIMAMNKVLTALFEDADLSAEELFFDLAEAEQQIRKRHERRRSKRASLASSISNQ